MTDLFQTAYNLKLDLEAALKLALARDDRNRAKVLGMQVIKLQGVCEALKPETHLEEMPKVVSVNPFELQVPYGDDAKVTLSGDMPGYRLLKAGEVLQEGDQYLDEIGEWGPVKTSIGWKLDSSDEEHFRRPLNAHVDPVMQRALNQWVEAPLVLDNASVRSEPTETATVTPRKPETTTKPNIP